MTDNRDEFKNLLAILHPTAGAQNWIADEIGYSYQQVSGWVTGKAEVPLVVLKYMRSRAGQMEPAVNPTTRAAAAELRKAARKLLLAADRLDPDQPL